MSENSKSVQSVDGARSLLNGAYVTAIDESDQPMTVDLFYDAVGLLNERELPKPYFLRLYRQPLQELIDDISEEPENIQSLLKRDSDGSVTSFMDVQISIVPDEEIAVDGCFRNLMWSGEELAPGSKVDDNIDRAVLILTKGVDGEQVRIAPDAVRWDVADHDCLTGRAQRVAADIARWKEYWEARSVPYSVCRDAVGAKTVGEAQPGYGPTCTGL